MAKLDLSANNKKQIIFPKDGIIIQKFIAGIKGGRTLVVENYPVTVIFSGTPVITDGNGTYKPMPLVAKTTTEGGQTVPVLDEDGNPVYELGSLPSGYAYAGILYKSILASKPAASIMTIGQVNEAALYYPITSIKSAFLTACPHIEFIKDEEA